MIESYLEAVPQLAVGGVVLELLLGALILRWGVGWRNRLSSPPIRVPDLGKALGVVGLALLISVPASIGFVVVSSVIARGMVTNDYQANGAGWVLAWVFLPFLFVAFFLLRTGIMAWLLRIDWDDALVVQLCETLMYFVAVMILGIVLLVLFVVTS